MSAVTAASTQVIWVYAYLYLFLDIRIFEEREAKWAKRTFTKLAKGLHDKEITNENETANQEKEEGKEVKIILYRGGIPETLGEKKVIEMFKGWEEKNPNWHYRDAYDQFEKLYPRAANGKPRSRWSTTHLSQQFAKNARPVNTNEDTKLPFEQTSRGTTTLEDTRPPVDQTSGGSTSLEMQKITSTRNDDITQEPAETARLIEST